MNKSNKHNNTITACSYSLSINPDVLAHYMPCLKELSTQYESAKTDAERQKILTALVGRVEKANG